MKTLRNRISNQDGCFSDLQGYAWAVEQGEQRGYHSHLLLGGVLKSMLTLNEAIIDVKEG